MDNSTIPCDDGYYTTIDNSITNAINYINFDIFALIAVTHLIHFGLKRLRQPIIISAVLAGLVTGHTCFRHTKMLRDPLIQANEDALNTFAERIGASFMLFIALHLDHKYIRRSLPRCLIILSATAVIPIIHAVSVSSINRRMSFINFLFYVHTSSPIAVRIITEMKLVSTEIGQFAIVAAVTNDLAYMVLIMFSHNIPSVWQNGNIKAWQILLTPLMIVVILVAVRPSVRWLNKRNQQRRYIRNYELLFILVFLVFVVFITEIVGINGAVVCFLVGLVFPREGAAIRTLKDKLRYIVHNLVLPVYFGWASSRIDIIMLLPKPIDMANTVVVQTVISVLGKVGGIVTTAKLLKIPFKEGLALGFILNVKGNIDILSLSNLGSLKVEIKNLDYFLMTILVNTSIAGATGTILARKKRKVYKRDVVQGLKQVKLDEEIRVLACVYNPVEVLGLLTLARLSFNGVPKNPFSILLLNIIGLPKNYNSHTLFYNQRHHKDDYDDEKSLGYEYKDVPQINACVDAFTNDTGIDVPQTTLASFFDKMHKHLYQDIYDFHRTLVLIPSHKEQRYDGKMVCRKEERRLLNLKILKEVPCTVGILMDRPVTGGIVHDNKETEIFSGCITPKSNVVTTDLYHVVAIFCGGPDDQEAMEYAGRLAMHPQTDVTVVRFVSTYRDVHHVSTTSSTTSNSELAMIIHKDDEERYLDDEFMIKFQQRFVEPGYVKYIEMYANNGTEIEAAMKSMVGMYSLFIVGRGRHPAAMMAGLSEWQECIEIGPIGDMLSSDAFMKSGSVLIIQCPNNKLTNKENIILESMFQSI